MASSYSTDLKLELMVTGENAGTWGDITNTNLNILQQAIAGYGSISVNATTGYTFTFTNGDISDGKNQVVKLTGTLAGNVNITIPDGIEKTYVVYDNLDHAGYTATFKTSSGSGVLLCEGNKYVLYADGTDVILGLEQRNWRAITTTETIQAGAQIFANTNAGAFTITLPASPATGDECTFVDQGYDFDVNALTIGRNGSNIANAAADLTINTQGAGFTLVYSGDATTGWTYRDK